MNPKQSAEASSIIDGATKLLVDTMEVLREADCQDYIVIGGWCPYLRNNKTVLHPGTLDVDLLFKEGNRTGALNDVVRAFVRRDFLPSAKHSFQLLREQTVKGQRLVYNVDLLHPKMVEEDRGLFVDHVDLDIRLVPSGVETKKLKSIVQPNSMVLFEHALYSPFEKEGVEINLVTFTGMLLTKIDSCQRPKRERDSFDIYLAALNNDIDVGKLQTICKENANVRESIKVFLRHLRMKADLFDKNVQQFAMVTHDSPARFVREALSALRLDRD